MQILFIAPVPPPVSGNSLAVQIFKNELAKTYNVDIVNFNKKRLRKYFSGFGRVVEVLKILVQVARKKNRAGVIYFSISESIAGNLKDICIYLICLKKLPKTIIHLHGGAGIREIFSDTKSIIYKINSFFIRRLAGVIVLGQTHVSIFDKILPKEKIHIVPNFAEDYLFINEEEINRKFHANKSLNILFLSNMIYGKGHNELVDAYLSLDDHFKKMIAIDFAGEFGSLKEQSAFLNKIKNLPQIRYRGFVFGKEKKDLFEKAHIFCLPTYYPYEGQPISILEAYASGCVVITTDHSGIKDVFSADLNGYQVEKKSVDSLKRALEKAVQNINDLPAIGLKNRNIADQMYRTGIYNESLKKLIVEIVG